MYNFAALASTSVLLLGSLLFHPFLGPSYWIEGQVSDSTVALFVAQLEEEDLAGKVACVEILRTRNCLQQKWLPLSGGGQQVF